jgi:hypothetical protein
VLKAIAAITVPEVAVSTSYYGITDPFFIFRFGEPLEWQSMSKWNLCKMEGSIVILDMQHTESTWVLYTHVYPKFHWIIIIFHHISYLFIAVLIGSSQHLESNPSIFVCFILSYTFQVSNYFATISGFSKNSYSLTGRRLRSATTCAAEVSGDPGDREPTWQLVMPQLDS